MNRMRIVSVEGGDELAYGFVKKLHDWQRSPHLRKRSQFHPHSPLWFLIRRAARFYPKGVRFQAVCADAVPDIPWGCHRWQVEDELFRRFIRRYPRHFLAFDSPRLLSRIEGRYGGRWSWTGDFYSGLGYLCIRNGEVRAQIDSFDDHPRRGAALRARDKLSPAALKRLDKMEPELRAAKILSIELQGLLNA